MIWAVLLGACSIIWSWAKIMRRMPRQEARKLQNIDRANIVLVDVAGACGLCRFAWILKLHSHSPHVFETAWFRTRKMASAAALKPQRCAIWVDCCVSDGDPYDVQTLLEHSDPFSTCSKGQGIKKSSETKPFSAKMFGSLIRGTLSAVNPSWSFKLFWHSGSLQRAAQIWGGEIVEMK